jgi:hypothetical protein
VALLGDWDNVLATRHDVDATIALLRDFVGDLPSGHAVARRFPR